MFSGVAAGQLQVLLTTLSFLQSPVSDMNFRSEDVAFLE